MLAIVSWTVVGWGVVLLLGQIVIISLAHLYLCGYWEREQRHFALEGLPATAPHFELTTASLSDSLLTRGVAHQRWQNIDEIQAARLERIAQAEQSIYFETFMMTPGRRADDLAIALQERALAGVTVQILIDAYGANSIPASYWHHLRQAGVEVRWFNPFTLRSPLSYQRRNHRKLLIVDQQTALVGGAGISDLWDGKDDNSGQIPWYDLEVEWRGEVVSYLTGLFWQQWLSAGGQVDLQHHRVMRSTAEPDTPILITSGEDPSFGNSPIRSLFQLAILSARERLWIASPYLLPDIATCNVLRQIKRQGIDVRILTMGVNSDKPYVYYVSRERYEPLLTDGVEIYEYQPSMMHAKLILIDQTWVSLGSANLDPRSLFQNDELNLCTSSAPLVEFVEHFFQQGFEHSDQIQLDRWRQRPGWQRLAGQALNLFYWQL